MLEKYQNVTVTGGLGFIGTHLVGELQSLGKNVTIIDSLWTSADRPVPKGVRFIEADIRDPRREHQTVTSDVYFTYRLHLSMEYRKAFRCMKPTRKNPSSHMARPNIEEN